MIKLFLDTEFTELSINAKLLSLGIVSDIGDEFYWEIDSVEELDLSDWIKENVVGNFIFQQGSDLKGKYSKEENIFYLRDKRIVKTSLKCSHEMLKTALSLWLIQISKENDQFEIWSDCLAYDWVLFNNIFGTAFDIPSSIYYIPFDICTLFKLKSIDPDINREDFADFHNGIGKHNALHDALVIKKCYKKLINE